MGWASSTWRNTIMDRLEVLKVVNRSADRFLREIQAAARLHHLNVVGAYSAQRLGNLLVFAMEYVDGEDLSQLVKSRGPLPIPHACNYVYQAALGLQHAHEQGMVHRDIKPSNLILTRDGKKPVVKILDFGLAKGSQRNGGGHQHYRRGGDARHSGLYRSGTDAGRSQGRHPERHLRARLYVVPSALGPTTVRRPEPLRDPPGPPFDRCDAVGHSPPGSAGRAGGGCGKDDGQGPGPSIFDAGGRGRGIDAVLQTGCAGGFSFRLDGPSGDGPTRAKPRAKSPPPLLEVEPARVAPVQTPALLRPSRRRRRNGAMIVAGLLLAAFAIALAAGALRVKTPNGTIVLEGLPPDAEVIVDGEKVTVSRNGDECVVTVNRGGPHALTLMLGGTEFGTSDATVKLGGAPFRVGIKDWVPRPELVPIPPAKVSDLPKPALDPSPEAKPTAPDRTARRNGAGHWEVKDKELIQTDADAENCVLVFGDPEWTDYDFTFDAVKTGGSFGVAALFRASDLKKYLVFDLAGWQNRKHTIEFDVDGHFNQWVKLDKAGSMAKDRRYRVEVRARGNHFVCSIDGKVIYDVHDDQVARGGVGLRCWGGAVRVSAIEVKSPDGKVLWQGPPDLSAEFPSKSAQPIRRPRSSPQPRFACRPTPSDLSSGNGKWTAANSSSHEQSLVHGWCSGTRPGRTTTSRSTPRWPTGIAASGCCSTTPARACTSIRRTRPSGTRTTWSSWSAARPTHTHYLEHGIDAEKTDWLARMPLEGDKRLKKGEWYTARVRVRGSRVQCFVNDTQVFDTETKAAPAGFVGLMTWSAPFRFRNIKVTNPTGKVLLEGLPDLSAGIQKTEGPAKIDPKIRESFSNRGDWSIDGTEIVQSNDQLLDCQIAFGDPAWTDFNFVCEAKVIAGFGGEMSQTFRVAEGGRYEWVLGRWNGHNYSLGSVAPGEKLERVWWAPLDREDREKKLDLDRWYKMEVRVRGSKVECFVDGVSVVKLDHDRHKAGRVGLRTFKTQVRFRNLKVTDPTGKVLFEGLPDLPAKTVDWLLDS